MVVFSSSNGANFNADGSFTPKVPTASLSRTLPAGDVMFNVISEGGLSGYTQPTYLVINNQEEWSSLWTQAFCTQAGHAIYPCPAAPSVDFAHQTVLAAFLGERWTECCRITFSNVKSIGLTIAATLTVQVLSPSCITIQSGTEPYHIIEIPKTTQQVTFTATTQTINC